MKSAEKLFDVLEYVILQNGKSVTPNMAADALALPPSTTVRALQQLASRGYLMQISRKAGYIPGPMAISLGTRENAYSKLRDAAEEPLSRLSGSFQSKINLAVLCGTGRVMLNIHIPGNRVIPWKRFIFYDHWTTATGRILIASLKDRDAKKICRDCAIKPFPGAELREIRENGWVRFPHHQWTIIGRRIDIPGYPVAAFGFGVPPEKAEEAFAASEAAAMEICEKLDDSDQAY